MTAALPTVLETRMFAAKAKRLLSDEENQALVDFVAVNYEKGAVMSGGIRKLRVPRPGGGKSGGYRVVYYFADRELPIFLITVFAKNEKANLSKAEQNEMSVLGKRLAETYGE